MNPKLSNFSSFAIIGTILLLISLQSCHLFRNINGGSTDLDTIITNNKKDTQQVVVNENNNNNITNNLPEKVDTIIWLDTLQRNVYEQLIVQYTKIGDQKVLKDTLEIINRKDNVDSAMGSNQERKIRVKPLYNVAVIMPFMVNRYDFRTEIPPQSLRAIEFYEGLKLALDSLDKEGVKLRVKVYDTERKTSKIREILEDKELKEADLIFGPVNSTLLRTVAEFGKKHDIPVVSTFNNNPKLVKDNHYYIQMPPDYSIHSRYIADFVSNHIEIPPSKRNLKKINHLIVGMQKDSGRVQKIQESYAIAQNDAAAKLPVYLSPNSEMSIEKIKQHFAKDALNVVIVPSYQKESFVSAVLRELHALVDRLESDKSYEFLVIGMPQWKYYERMNFEYYENLNLHISDAFYINYENQDIQNIEKSYRQVYGIAPREFAYIGFDAMLYFGRLLKKHGTGFPNHFSKEITVGKSNRFYFDPIMNIPNIVVDDQLVEDPRINHFVNQYVHILKFSDFEFKPVATGFVKPE